MARQVAAAVRRDRAAEQSVVEADQSVGVEAPDMAETRYSTRGNPTRARASAATTGTPARWTFATPRPSSALTSLSQTGPAAPMATPATAPRPAWPETARAGRRSTVATAAWMGAGVAAVDRAAARAGEVEQAARAEPRDKAEAPAGAAAVDRPAAPREGEVDQPARAEALDKVEARARRDK